MANATAVRLRSFFAAGDDDTPKWHMTTDGPEIVAMLSGNSPEWTEDVDFGEVYVFNQLIVDTVTLYRYRNRLSGDHFFTTSETEGNQAIVKYDCVPEGICCYLAPTQSPGTVPLYRLLYNNKYHRYLTNADVRAIDMYRGWAEDEGITGFVWTSPVSLPAQ